MPETEQKEFSGPKDIKDKSDQPTWNALDANEKIERMRGIVKDLQKAIEWQSRRFQELSDQIRALEEHGHTDGRVMIPVLSKHRGQTCGRETDSASKVLGWF